MNGTYKIGIGIIGMELIFMEHIDSCSTYLYQYDYRYVTRQPRLLSDYGNIIRCVWFRFQVFVSFNEGHLGMSIALLIIINSNFNASERCQTKEMEIWRETHLDKSLEKDI